MLKAEAAPLRIPEAGRARALVWAALLAAAGMPAWTPAEPGALAPRRVDGTCRLSEPGAGPPCACTELGARLRLVSGRPLDLNRATLEELAWLPGIGPVRARAIAVERSAGGRYASLDDLARRVRGIGPVRAARLAARAGVGVGAGVAGGAEDGSADCL